jgi:hypothetical protein
MTSDHDVALGRNDRMEGRERVLRLLAGQIDRLRVRATGPKAVDERCHAGRVTARAMTQEDAESHIDSLAAR